MLTLPRAFLKGMVAHARAVQPQECCGLIATDGRRAVRRYELRNCDPSVYRYRADPDDLFAALHEMWAREWELLAIYHSHTYSPAFPSPTDVRQAYYPESASLIVSLQEPDRPVVRAFRITAGVVSEEPLLVEG